ncbi:Uma2 family endonuclease [Thermosynechococcus sp. PKX82]|nr:Uma2 family endonuclease [Thermosynechococcus sp. PKX82]
MTSTTAVDSSPLLLNVRNATVQVTPEQFDQLCRDNPDLRLELTKAGELIVMPPTGEQTGAQNFELIVEWGFGTGKRNWGVPLIPQRAMTLQLWGAANSPQMSLGLLAPA